MSRCTTCGNMTIDSKKPVTRCKICGGEVLKLHDLIAAIRARAMLTNSGAYVAKGFNHSDLDAAKDYITNRWPGATLNRAVMFPVGYEGTEHFDSVTTVVYYPQDHTSGVLIDGKRAATIAGDVVLIPAGIPHQIEAVTDKPRYSIVWELR